MSAIDHKSLEEAARAAYKHLSAISHSHPHLAPPALLKKLHDALGFTVVPNLGKDAAEFGEPDRGNGEPVWGTYRGNGAVWFSDCGTPPRKEES